MPARVSEACLLVGRFESSRLRQKGFCKYELSASLHSAANSCGIFGEKEKDLSMKGKRNFFIEV